MTYIHELEAWPGFTWDSEALMRDLADCRLMQGRLLGSLSQLGFDLRAEASVACLTDEIINTSAIEGENLDREDVRSSVGRRLGIEQAGMDPAGRQVEGLVDLMMDATRNYAEPLTRGRLFNWHTLLFPFGKNAMGRIRTGAWRNDRDGAMEVVSGPIGNQRVHFVAPPASLLSDEMNRFLEWFNAPSDVDAILKAGVAHLWFITIHPFEDGNGRVARAIAELALTRSDQTPDRFYSMSSAIEAEKDEYYRQLELAQKSSMDVTTWLGWFLACFGRTLTRAEKSLSAVLHKARIWQFVNQYALNNRQRRIVTRLLDSFKGHLTTTKYAKLAKCSHDTALRDIKEMLSWGILIQNPGGGRSTSYRLVSVQEIGA